MSPASTGLRAPVRNSHTYRTWLLLVTGARLAMTDPFDTDRSRLARPGRRRDQHGQLPGDARHEMLPDLCSVESVMTQQRFVFEVPEADLGDLRARLRGTRWPIPWPATGW